MAGRGIIFWVGFEFESLLIIPVTLTLADYPSLFLDNRMRTASTDGRLIDTFE